MFGPGRCSPSSSMQSAPDPRIPARCIVSVVDRPGTGQDRAATSHGLGLNDAISLATALDRMPARLIVHAIEAADLEHGTGLTPAVAAAVDLVASAILDDIGADLELIRANLP